MKRIFIILFLCIGILATTNAQKNKVTQAAENVFEGATIKEAKLDPTGKIM